MKKLLSALSVSLFSVLLIFNAAGCSTAQPEQIEEPNADFSGSNSDYVQSPDYEEQGQNGNSADYAALYEDTYRSVVTVNVTTDRISPKTGTGVLIESEEGYLLTSSSLFELTVENHTFWKLIVRFVCMTANGAMRLYRDLRHNKISAIRHRAPILILRKTYRLKILIWPTQI